MLEITFFAGIIIIIMNRLGVRRRTKCKRDIPIPLNIIIWLFLKADHTYLSR